MLVISAVMTKQRREIGTEGTRGSQVGNLTAGFNLVFREGSLKRQHLKEGL